MLLVSLISASAKVMLLPHFVFFVGWLVGSSVSGINKKIENVFSRIFFLGGGESSPSHVKHRVIF